MTFTEIRGQVDVLPAEEQDKLAAYLTMLRKSRDPSYEEELRRRLSDNDASHWISLDALRSDAEAAARYE